MMLMRISTTIWTQIDARTPSPLMSASRFVLHSSPVSRSVLLTFEKAIDTTMTPTATERGGATNLRTSDLLRKRVIACKNEVI